MKYSILLLSLILMLVLSSCTDVSTEEKSGSNNTETSEKEPMERIGTDQEDYVKKPEDAASVDSNAASSLLPLKPGFYVMGNDCEHPANAGWRYWSGQGLSGASTVSCQMKMVGQAGKEYSVSQTCVNTYDKSTSASDLKLVIENDGKFTLTEGGKSQVFKRCENTPTWINY